MTEKQKIKRAKELYGDLVYPKTHIELYVDGYLAGAREFEDQIADIKANCDLAIEGRDIKIKELETENNKLLDVINNQDVKIADLEKKLEQAKEIIKKFLSLRHDCKEKDCPCESLICETIDERAEQFLKEIEK